MTWCLNWWEMVILIGFPLLSGVALGIEGYIERLKYWQRTGRIRIEVLK